KAAPEAAAGRDDLRDMVVATLGAMAKGGMRDHLGGGFHRYSVDERWRVPHFEKMLYDQAQLVLALIEASQAASDRLLAAVADVLERPDDRGDGPRRPDPRRRRSGARRPLDRSCRAGGAFRPLGPVAAGHANALSSLACRRGRHRRLLRGLRRDRLGLPRAAA